tara:strand:+ start:328 stop:543 length:216 start_codon:yes stop_codon:yes gene_type:complete
MGDKKSSKTQEKKQQVDKVVDLIEQWLVLFDIDPQQIVDVMTERQKARQIKQVDPDIEAIIQEELRGGTYV